jgi:hypothetical protein
MQITDTQQFDIDVTADDSKGNAVPDTLTWTISSTAGTTLTVDDATTLKVTIVAGAPEAGIVATATDPNGVTGNVTFDVVGGAAAILNLTPGTPTDQPAPVPAP